MKASRRKEVRGSQAKGQNATFRQSLAVALRSSKPFRITRIAKTARCLEKDLPRSPHVAGFIDNALDRTGTESWLPP